MSVDSPPVTAWIDDGFQLEATIPAIPGFAPEVNFFYRPALPHFKYQYDRLQYGLSEAETRRILTDIVMGHMNEVYAKGPTGDKVRLSYNAESIWKLKPHYAPIMAEYIVGARYPVLKQSLGKSPTGSDSSSCTPNTPTENAPTAQSGSMSGTEG